MQGLRSLLSKSSSLWQDLRSDSEPGNSAELWARRKEMNISS